jgi:hypothetical protein
MSAADAFERLKQIVDRERADGCPMADESLIESALRHWRSYPRRFKRHRDQSLEHRAHDLEKGLIALFPEHNYDPGCLRHLAESFAAALFSDTAESGGASHTSSAGQE